MGEGGGELGSVALVTDIGVVFNPRAGGNRHDPGGPARLARILGRHGVIEAPPSLDALHETALAFRARKVRILAISGGDGTNNMTLSFFRRVYGDEPLPLVAMIRGGTMNTIANGCGVERGSVDKLLRRLIERADGGRTPESVARSTMLIRDRVGFLFGTGVIAGYLREYYGTGAPSPWTAARVLTRAVGSALVGGPLVRRMAATVRAEVTFQDGTRWDERDYLSVAAGTVDQIGLGFRPFHRVHERLGAFHLLGIHTSAVGFAQDLPRIHRGVGIQPDKALAALTDRAVIRFTDPAAGYMFDGDLLDVGAEPLVLAAGPTLRVATLR